MEIPLVSQIVVIFGLSIVVIFICHQFRLPAIVGLLLTGVLAGPRGLGLISAVHEVEILAEIGVVLLLFAIGIEFSLKDLIQIKRAVLLGGALQVGMTILVTYIIVRQLGLIVGQALFLGFLVALSSTAIVLKLLQERGEIDSPHGRTALAVLIFQDIIVVPMMLFTPLLAGAEGNVGRELLILLAKGVGVIIFVLVSAEWIVPRALFYIARTRSRELFLLSVVFIGAAVAWLTSEIGLSLALGAFLAGLTISESEYSHQAFGNILPFRDIFTSFFFVSIGMLLDVEFLLQQPLLIGLISLVVLAVKGFIVTLAVLLLGFPLRTALIAGLALSQVGEFSFILSRAGIDAGLLGGSTYQFFLDVAILTMAATAFIIALAPRLADWVLRLPLPERLKTGLYPAPTAARAGHEVSLQDHLIIVGFGLNGRNVARAAKMAGVPYLIIEMNPQTVLAERSAGEPIYYGDAMQETVLEHAGIKEARVLVVVISDPLTTRRITAVARQLNQGIHVIARTRYVSEVKPLHEAGANEVIPEEFETSVEIFARVLASYLVPREEIEHFIAEVRAGSYGMFRQPTSTQTLSDLEIHLSDVEVSTFRINNSSPFAGQALRQAELRNKYGVTVLAIRRDLQLLPNPAAETQLHAGDVLVVLGEPDKIAVAADLFAA